MVKRRCLAALGLVAIVLTGCSQASAPADDPVVAASDTTSASTSVTAPTSAPGTSSAPSTTSVTPTATTSEPSTTAPSSTAPASTPAPSSTAPTSVAPAGPAGCTTAALAVSVRRGSGVAGHQFAFLDFTNSSARTCSLSGFPGVQLLLGGKALGKPAVRSAKTAKTITLKAGATVTAQVTDASTCNASNSDQIQIFPPNETHRIVLSLSLRGCALTVDPVAAG